MLDNFNYTGECRLYCQKYRCLDNQGGIIIVCWMGKKNSFWAKYLIRFSSSFFFFFYKFFYININIIKFHCCIFEIYKIFDINELLLFEKYIEIDDFPSSGSSCNQRYNLRLHNALLVFIIVYTC